MAFSSSASLCAAFPVVRLRDSAAFVPAFFAETGLAAGPAWLKSASAARSTTAVVEREYFNSLSWTISGSWARNISPIAFRPLFTVSGLGFGFAHSRDVSLFLEFAEKLALFGKITLCLLGPGNRRGVAHIFIDGGEHLGRIGFVFHFYVNICADG